MSMTRSVPAKPKIPGELFNIQLIINLANKMQISGGSSYGSTGETIAAAFVLNKPEFFPDNYDDMVDAWDRLDEEWQAYVRQIKKFHMHSIKIIE